MYNKTAVFWAACFGMLLFGIGLITPGSIASDLKEKFELNDKMIGGVFSILPAGILLGSLLFGPICDRSGYKTILILACLGMTIGFEGIALVSSLNALKLSVLIFGLSAGIINGATNALVSDISDKSKGANLSLLGVFFGIGALGMPFLLALLMEIFTDFQIVMAMGGLTLATAVFYSRIKFPPSKKELGFPLKKAKTLFKESYLYLIAFYLFFQGGLESILNNWTTIYLTSYHFSLEKNALFALTLYVAGMIAMRLLIGSVFRRMGFFKLMIVSFLLILSGVLLVHLGSSFNFSVAGLIFLGIGLAAGFPIMLGLAGEKYSAQSGTAFSIIFTIALFGNIFINKLMGFVAKNYGIQHYTSLLFVELACMLFLFFFIFREKNKLDTQPS